ncbi:MAG TPA: tetratricopeptide repeat protein [Phototrophicaceae bacterium]|nr:tetratricopeptide repeat protein [Phototrophicaceae bacterium]
MDTAGHAELLRRVRLALQSGDYQEAVQCLEQAAQAATAAQDLSTAGRHLGNLALIYHQRLQRPDLALGYFQQALATARAEGDRLTEDGLLGNMGNILRELRRYDEAIDYLNQALLIAQEIGDVRGRGIWLSNLGLVYDDLSRLPEAIEVHKEAVSVARSLHDQRGLIGRLTNLGNSYVVSSHHAEALKCFHEVVALYRELGDKPSAAAHMGLIGNIYCDLGRAAPSAFEAHLCFDLALQAFNETLVLARELSDLPAEAELMSSLGYVYGSLGDYVQAEYHFTAAYTLFVRLGLAERLDYLQQNIALAQQAQGG